MRRFIFAPKEKKTTKKKKTDGGNTYTNSIVSVFGGNDFSASTFNLRNKNGCNKNANDENICFCFSSVFYYTNKTTHIKISATKKRQQEHKQSVFLFYVCVFKMFARVKKHLIILAQKQPFAYFYVLYV